MENWIIEQIKAGIIVLIILSIQGFFNNLFQMYLYEH